VLFSSAKLLDVAARKEISREAVLDEARSLVAAEGLSGLSLRSLARRLGISSPALQWHAGSRDQLLLDLADSVVAGIPLPDPDLEPVDWLRLAATATRSHFASQAALLPLVRDLASYLPALLDVKAAYGRALAATGLQGADLEHAFNAYVGFVFGYAYAQHAQMVALSRSDPGRYDALDARRASYEGDPIASRLLSTTRSAAPGVTPVDLDESFARGVDALLAGLGIDQPAPPARRRPRKDAPR
jgi:AcrR family transcriptional regulator